MSGKAVVVVMGMAIGVATGPAEAQGARPRAEPARQGARLNQSPSPQEQLRYKIGTMERVLENAVEHGASVWRDRLQALAPVQALLLDNARVRGYRLDGYGMFFDVDVPSLETTLFSAFRTLDQNGLGVQSAFNTVRNFVQVQGANDANLLQALKRIELQVVPPGAISTTADISAARTATGAASVSAASVSAAAVAPDPPAANLDPDDPILINPEEVYRAEVMRSVLDALLDYSGPLGLAPDDWLTVAVRRNEARPRLGLDSNAQTVVARVRGADLVAFHARQLTRDEALKRVEVGVF